eukprot:m.242330 g.242330  ORF g.242330 m.242330 type:complete len:346 (-) comp25523_c0_seq1:848-1885(-)
MHAISSSSVLGSQKLLQVLIDVLKVGTAQTEIVAEKLHGLRGDKSRHVGAQRDVLDTEVQQGEQHCNGLLLKPRNGKADGESVDVSVESLGKGRGNHHGTVAVVALAHVDDAGEGRVGDVAKVELVEAVLAAAEGEDHGGRRGSQSQVAVIVALALVTVAATNDKDVLQVALLDGVNDLAGQRQQCLVSKAHGDGLLGVLVVLSLDKPLHALRLLDDGAKVLLVATNVRHVGPAHSVACIDAILVRLAGLDQAVGGHDNGAGELGKLKLLKLPRATVVAGKVLVLAESGVAVRGQHLTMRKHIHTLALTLLQQLLEVKEIVAAHKNRLAVHGGDLDRCRRGVAKV